MGSNARVLPRELPPLPDWARPVGVARPAEGTDWRVIAATEQRARLENASRLTCLAGWYEQRRADYAGRDVAAGVAGCGE